MFNLYAILQNISLVQKSWNKVNYTEMPKRKTTKISLDSFLEESFEYLKIVLFETFK